MNDDEFYKHAKDEMFPKMKASALSIAIINAEPDPKLCLELGAAILFDKPIVLLVIDKEMKLPANLKRVASAIVFGHPSEPSTRQAIQDAIGVVANDNRRTQQ